MDSISKLIGSKLKQADWDNLVIRYNEIPRFKVLSLVKTNTVQEDEDSLYVLNINRFLDSVDSLNRRYPMVTTLDVNLFRQMIFGLYLAERYNPNISSNHWISVASLPFKGLFLAGITILTPTLFNFYKNHSARFSAFLFLPYLVEDLTLLVKLATEIK